MSITFPSLVTQDFAKRYCTNLFLESLCSFKIPNKQDTLDCFLSTFSWEVVAATADSSTSYVLPRNSKPTLTKEKAISLFSRGTLIFMISKTIPIVIKHFLFYQLRRKISSFYNLPPYTKSKEWFFFDLLSVFGEMQLYLNEERFKQDKERLTFSDIEGTLAPWAKPYLPYYIKIVQNGMLFCPQAYLISSLVCSVFSKESIPYFCNKLIALSLFSESADPLEKGSS